MTTIVPRLNMTDAELEALAERRGLELTVPPSVARAALEAEMYRLARRLERADKLNTYQEK